MRRFPRDEAVASYRRLYWLRPGFDQVAEHAPALAAELFDTGVNMGPPVAAGFLQRALNALNRGARDSPDISVDRPLGPRTLVAHSGLAARRASAWRSVLPTAVRATSTPDSPPLRPKAPPNTT